MASLESRYVTLSWRLIEYKVMYYRPEDVHETRRALLTISDDLYDTLEVQYLTLCRELGHANTVVHKGYPGFEDVEDRSMIGIDETRPSVQMVISLLKTKYTGDII